MPVEIEMESLPGQEQVDNILADITRVFVIEIRKQTSHVSGTAIEEEYNETIQWSLPKGIMVKIMKVAHMWYQSNPSNVQSRWAAEAFLNDETFETDLGVDGVLGEINDLFLRGGIQLTTGVTMFEPWERNWEPGKVLPKNEIQISIQNGLPATEAYAGILTQVMHIHYQLFRFDEVDSDRMVWEKSTTSQ